MVQIDKSKCIGCKKCSIDCLANNIDIVDKKAKIKGDCILCGHCVAVCPTSAVSIPEYDMEDVENYQPHSFHLDADRLLHAIKFRRSIRHYKPEPVEADKINRIINAGRYTATAKNNQGCRFVIVQNELDKLKNLVWNNIESQANQPIREIPKEFLPFVAFHKRWKANPSDDYLFRNAPAVVYITSDWPLDAGLAAQNMELLAVAQGLGVLYNGYLCRVSDQNMELKKWLGIEDTTIRACMLLGYPATTYARTAPRKKAQTIIR
ncbi:nitroreductase family protein [Lachnospiraceae bacterium OttesenSCG-928-E19]|nr:nitroreductase family protein [Lachnospiraceae bacterium OttesenSCG-928-E19]